MALQAGLPPLDFSGFELERQEEYFTAVRHGLDRDYKPMEKVFTDVITYSLLADDEQTVAIRPESRLFLLRK